MNWLERVQLSQFGWHDAVDVLLVAVVVYTILKLMRGTKAMQMAVGVFALAAVFFAARWFRLLALETLFREFLFYAPFALIVIFQQELRQVLSTVGRNPLMRFLAGRPGPLMASELVRGAEQIAKRHLGALIVLEGTQSLRAFIDSGKVLDAELSAELLLSIFNTAAPLHDGAVVIRNGRVAAAGVLLPLSANPDGGTRRHGTRHRAALGMSEETDSLVIVVSEENQSIGVAYNGALHENVDATTLAALIGDSATGARA